MERCIQLKFFLDDGDEDVDRHGDPDLRFHRILGCAVETLDVQMLLDPLERLGDILPIGTAPRK
jgi:hypothetical protein